MIVWLQPVVHGTGIDLRQHAVIPLTIWTGKLGHHAETWHTL